MTLPTMNTPAPPATPTVAASRRRLERLTAAPPPHTSSSLGSTLTAPPAPPAPDVRHLQEVPESVSTVPELIRRLNRSQPEVVPVAVVLAPVVFPLGGVTLLVQGRVVLSGEGAVLDGEWGSTILQVRAPVISGGANGCG